MDAVAGLVATLRATTDDHLGISVREEDDGRRWYLDRQPYSLTAVRRQAS